MLARFKYAASWLLMLVVQQSSSSAVYHDYIVVGAGPAGLQLGYFLERSRRDYVILERGTQAGASPITDTLMNSSKLMPVIDRRV